MAAGGAGGGGRGRGLSAGDSGSGPPRAPDGALPAWPQADRLPPELLKTVARAVPADNRLCLMKNSGRTCLGAKLPSWQRRRVMPWRKKKIFPNLLRRRLSALEALQKV